MAELTERQLLLLSNLMYFAGSNQLECSVEKIAELAIAEAETYNIESRTLSGGFEESPGEMIDIANAIKADPELCGLTVSMSYRSNGVHAVCLVDSEGNATVAVRGTGGTYEAWSDNLEGAYGSGTEVQREFGEFMQDVAARYDDITITGHSKGGNLAQYATVTMGDKIDRCVSFDGQGFSFEFCQKYADEIRANSYKIKSVNGEKDIVNTLLQSIADETVYLNTNDELHPHSPYNLWSTNEGKDSLDANGEYCMEVDRALWPGIVDSAAFLMTLVTTALPDDLETSVVDFIGSCVGWGFSKKTGWLSDENMDDFKENLLRMLSQFERFSDIEEAIKETLEDLRRHGQHFKEWVDEKFPFLAGAKECAFMVRGDGLGKGADTLKGYSLIASEIAEELSGVELTGSGLVGVKYALRKLESRIRGHAAALSRLGENLYEVRELYSGAEDRTCAAYSEI